ncbi:MAG: FAD-dependent oxidoreductase [Bacteroidales bacterium]|jgi:heterodisulfide reductase subunit A|nr:FAD-dependent oxidoreductase [Bacteroidales bacterium]
MRKTVAIIGGGITGMEAAIQINKLGHTVHVFEKDEKLGGHVAQWDHVFPNQRKAREIINELTCQISEEINIHLSSFVEKISQIDDSFVIKSDNNELKADAIVLASGFELFSASKKEEYGYGIFENVITSVDLERMFVEKGHPFMRNGEIPQRIAFIHCVGSRDEKVKRTYCSKVCCITAVKQAIEVKESIPEASVYNLYMDLRMFGPGYEDMYQKAQQKGITFIRGRLSEASEVENNRILIKTEDTLSSRPIKMTVDLIVLMIGISPSLANNQILSDLKLEPNKDGFAEIADDHLSPTHSKVKGVFIAGACTGPCSITDAINASRSASVEVHHYLNQV